MFQSSEKCGARKIDYQKDAISAAINNNLQSGLSRSAISEHNEHKHVVN